MMNLEQIEATIQSLKGRVVSVGYKMSETRNVFGCVSGILLDACNFDENNMAYFCVASASGDMAIRFTSADIISFTTDEKYGRPVIGITL